MTNHEKDHQNQWTVFQGSKQQHTNKIYCCDWPAKQFISNG